MKNAFLIIVLFILFASCAQPQTNNAPDFSSVEWIDLSYPYNESTIYWPTADGFSIETVFEGETDGGYYYSAYNITSAEHGGTHLDAPIHFSEGKHTVDQLSLNQLTGAAVVVDVSERALADNDYLVSVEDFTNWESKHGQLPNDIMILIRTGYGQFWPDAEKYMGTTERGEAAVAKLHFPGLHPDAATWLTTERNIKAIGLDTPSIDYGQSTFFESHRILFKENIPAFENIANLDQLPETGIYVVALPMKIEGGSGGAITYYRNNYL